MIQATALPRFHTSHYKLCKHLTTLGLEIYGRCRFCEEAPEKTPEHCGFPSKLRRVDTTNEQMPERLLCVPETYVVIRIIPGPDVYQEDISGWSTVV